ncbi:unnamed protein product [Anisakis simplex]|uniref:Equilibrative nucleoside transporter, putative (inferred by orthology to a S. mansoni protein) n=1 Tax=Anisakis simplex TaxID=6269 RepID=A0A0M3K506_ANISI|nr:unnamed protein product [Anisakis simplex]
MEKQGMLSEKGPADKGHLVYLIMLLHGVGTLMPWNMFITIAPAYFVNYKLMETDEQGVRHSTPYSRNFFSYLGICSQLPCLLMNLINIFIESKTPLIGNPVVSGYDNKGLQQSTLAIPFEQSAMRGRTYPLPELGSRVRPERSSSIRRAHSTLFAVDVPAALLPLPLAYLQDYPSHLFIRRGGLVRRIAVSLVVVGCICVITLLLVLVDTSHMVTTFFLITMITVMILNGANGIYQNSIFGLVSAFPQQFTNAIVVGNNLCGTFVSLINIVTLLVADTIEVAAVGYFAIALLTVAACFGSVFILPKLDFYRYYQNKAAESHKDIDLDQPNKPNASKLQLYLDVFKQVWVQCMNVFLTFFVTLTIFPAIMAEIKLYRADGKYDFILPEFLFTPVTTFLLFNLLAMIGSTVANFVQWPSPRFLSIPVLIRLSLIPLMMFCNYRPARRTWPVYFTSEYVYFVFAIIMSFTNGYFSSLGMMYAPKSVDKSKAAVAGMMSAFFLIFGICCGVAFTFFVAYFTDYLGPNAQLLLP